MKQADIIIKHALIVNSDRQFNSDIIIQNGRITNLIPNNLQNPYRAETIINADGMYVFPGFIDPHVHFHLPTPAGFSSDDFDTGTRAALRGGTTTIIDFVTPKKTETLPEAVRKRQAEAAKAHCNYALHLSPIGFNENTQQEIETCIKQGINSFKVYMAYKDSIGLHDDALRKVMQVLAKHNKLLLIHAETGDEIDVLRDNLFSEGKTAPKYHPISRPNHTESDAVKKAVEMSKETGCPIYIVHVSAAESIEHIRKAKAQGVKIYAETCPHYLLLDESLYDQEFSEAAKYVLSPPLRKAGNQQVLWRALSDGTFDTVGTDHCPFHSTQKNLGISDFRKIPNGAGSTEHRASLLYTYGVLQNRINLQQFVNLASTNASKIFGMYPKRGEIAKKSVADIVIWNPHKKSIISAASHTQNTDISIYEGFEIQGEPETVLLNGKIFRQEKL